MGIYENYRYSLSEQFNKLSLFPQQPHIPVDPPKPRVVDDIHAKTSTLEEACIVAETFNKTLPGYTVTVKEVLEGCDYTISAVKYEDK